MSTDFNALAEFERLLANFDRDLSSARVLKSPNVEDTLEVRVAIVGFSYNSKTEIWAMNHVDYLKRKQPAPSDASDRERCFWSLCVGYLLGLFQSERITQSEFRLAEAQLPGFMMLKSGTV